MQQSETLPAILLKPGASSAGPLYQKEEAELDGIMAIRSLSLSGDMELIYEWVNQAYSRRFWQLNGSKQVLLDTYIALLENPRAHSFMIELNQLPIAQIDVYGIAGEELQEHTDGVNELDCGLHLLMLPPKEMQKGWSWYCLKNFIRFYFSFPYHQQLFAEPDQQNTLANKLAMDAGFQFLKTVQLSNKTANLYSISRTS